MITPLHKEQVLKALASVKEGVEQILTKRRMPKPGGCFGQQCGLEVWRAAYTGREYGALLDRIYALECAIRERELPPGHPKVEVWAGEAMDAAEWKKLKKEQLRRNYETRTV